MPIFVPCEISLLTIQSMFMKKISLTYKENKSPALPYIGKSAHVKKHGYS